MVPTSLRKYIEEKIYTIMQRHLSDNLWTKTLLTWPLGCPLISAGSWGRRTPGSSACYPINDTPVFYCIFLQCARNNEIPFTWTIWLFSWISWVWIQFSESSTGSSCECERDPDPQSNQSMDPDSRSIRIWIRIVPCHHGLIRKEVQDPAESEQTKEILCPAILCSQIRIPILPYPRRKAGRLNPPPSCLTSDLPWIWEILFVSFSPFSISLCPAHSVFFLSLTLSCSRSFLLSTPVIQIMLDLANKKISVHDSSARYL